MSQAKLQSPDLLHQGIRQLTVKGAASGLAQMDARMRVEGASEKDRGGARRESHVDIGGELRSEQKVPIQGLASMSALDRALAEAGNAKTPARR